MTADQKTFSRPESVLVVVHTPALDCLLLERVSPAGFWQSVTGTLLWGETPAAAAVREVAEETSLATDSGLRETGVANAFPILPEWRDRYASGVTRNVEHLWYLEIDQPVEIALNAAEHSAYRWLPIADAIALVSSRTNREALERLAQGAGPG